jgi:hypothetical protein
VIPNSQRNFMILDISNRSNSKCNLTCAELRKGARGTPALWHFELDAQ